MRGRPRPRPIRVPDRGGAHCRVSLSPLISEREALSSSPSLSSPSPSPPSSLCTSPLPSAAPSQTSSDAEILEPFQNLLYICIEGQRQSQIEPRRRRVEAKKKEEQEEEQKKNKKMSRPITSCNHFASSMENLDKNSFPQCA